MADHSVQQGACPNLPFEVWKQILSHLPDLSDGPPHKLASDDLGEEIWEQHVYLELYRVCHLFNQVLSEKASYLVLIETNWDLEGLLNWFKRDLHRCQAVQHLIAWGDSASVDIVLGILRVHSNRMKKIELREYTGHTLQLVSGFSTLKECTLHQPVVQAGGVLDLAPLQQLANLESLTLAECKVSCLNAAGCLTRLELQECRATCSAHFGSAASLLELSLQNSRMQVLTAGLSACVSLRLLDFDNSSLSVRADPAESFTFNRHSVVVTSRLSSLSALTSLEMCLKKEVHVDAFQQITDLRSLQALKLAIDTSCFKLSDCFSTLCRLQHVSFSSSSCQLHFDLDWAGLRSLRSIELSGTFDIQGSFRGLVAVTAFQRLSLGYLMSGSSAHMQMLGFAIELGVLRPDVELVYHIRVPSTVTYVTESDSQSE